MVPKTNYLDLKLNSTAQRLHQELTDFSYVGSLAAKTKGLCEQTKKVNIRCADELPKKQSEWDKFLGDAGNFLGNTWDEITDFAGKATKSVGTVIDDFSTHFSKPLAVLSMIVGGIALGAAIVAASPTIVVGGALLTKIVTAAAVVAKVTGGTAIVGGGIQTITGELKITLTGESLSLEESLARKSDGAQSMIMGLIGLAGGVFALDMINKNPPPVSGDGDSGAKVSADDIKFTDKFSKPVYQNQVIERGWNNQKIADAINNPYKVLDSVNKFTGNQAKVYFINDTHYVVIDAVINKVVQVSDLSDEFWKFTPGKFTR